MRVALDAKFYFDPQPTVMLRDHDSNAGKAVRRNVEMAEELTSRFRADKVYPKSLDRDVDWFLANLNLGAGWITIRTLPEERSWGAQQYRKAIRRSPRIAAKPRYLLGAVMMVLPAKAVTWLNRQFDRRSNYLGNRQNIRG